MAAQKLVNYTRFLQTWKKGKIRVKKDKHARKNLPKVFDRLAHSLC
jgi:hypothetical protein